ncbi:energy-coupling factor ABC transporter ATP-binding protein [Nocardioides sp. DS6]|uniref:Energy-coupling factor ABC transporter ATP-binding protein n=1 Tax=Nocardioides eburneus TaxID=3231482 RepID=A0ABV3SWT7_9ACTN
MAEIRLEGAEVRIEDADGASRTILSPTTLTLTEQRIGVIGGNGSGKSTLARLVNGLVEPTAGRVSVDGLDVVRHGAAVRRKVGFCFTDPAAQLVMPTCVEDVELSLRRTVKDRVRRRQLALETLARFGLAERADVSVHALSGGQRQLLALAGVLATEPEVLVCDEPTTLLDLRNTRMIGDLLLSLPQQLVLVSHDLDLVRRCDRVLVVEDGAVRFDGPAEEAVADYVASVDPADPATSTTPGRTSPA